MQILLSKKNIIFEAVNYFKNPKMALVQYPQTFYNKDPFQLLRNSLVKRVVIDAKIMLLQLLFVLVYFFPENYFFISAYAVYGF